MSNQSLDSIKALFNDSKLVFRNPVCSYKALTYVEALVMFSSTFLQSIFASNTAWNVETYQDVPTEIIKAGFTLEDI